MTAEPIDALACEPLDDFDIALLGDLARIVQLVDPPPAGLCERIRFELTLAALNAEVAELQDLSLAVEVRAETFEVADTISFTSSQLSLMITVAPNAPESRTLRIDGWITSPGATVELWQDGDRYTAIADEDGRLVWEAVPKQASRFLVPGTPPVVTPRIEL